MATNTRGYCAFSGDGEMVRGTLLEVALSVRERSTATGQAEPVQIFDLEDGRVVDVLLEGTDQSIADWIAQHVPGASPAQPRLRGRPKLGVVGREVTLLPRQWEWLGTQRGGASVTLRRLVDEAAKQPKAARDAAREATFRFLNAIAGDYAGFEEALRALYAGDRAAFMERLEPWPEDVQRLAGAFAEKAW